MERKLFAPAPAADKIRMVYHQKRRARGGEGG
jgi:hypothetical protein